MTDQNQYLGNPNLKRANVSVEFTKEQIQEYQKCMDDPGLLHRKLYEDSFSR